MEWFGSIPERWDTRKIGDLFTERREKVSDKDYAPLSVSKGGIVPQIATVAKTNAGDNRKRVCVGDFVINSRSDRRGSSGVSQYGGSVSLINIVLAPRGEHNGRYFHYLLRSHSFIEEYYRNGRGIVADLWTTRHTEMKPIYLPLPPREEQDQIVRFLDWKVSSINKLIGAKRKQIALLEEQKKAMINQVVTRNGDGWVQYRMKNLFRERNERSVDGSEMHLSMSQKYGLVSDDKLEERRMLSESYEGAKLCLANDIVLNRLKAHLGVFALANQDGVISPDYTVLKPVTTRILPKYAIYYLTSDVCRDSLRVKVRGVVEGFWRLYTDDFYSIAMLLPQLDEQERIVFHLDIYGAKTNQLIEKVNAEVALLQEYRTRLISDVVTGKFDVRDVAVLKYETVADKAIVNKVLFDDEEIMGNEANE
jgi:type I restriction enzyme S subunit